MINVVQEIVDKLRTVYPSAQYDIYTERIEQGFSAPCFSIRQLRADVTPYPSGLHEIVQHMDVRFFPSDGRPQEQCRETAQTLTLLLRRTESLRGSNLSWEITDEVLHFFADYRQFVREIPEVTECYNISGDYDYLLKIHAPDMKYYQEFIINVLGTIESMGSLMSTFVMDEVKHEYGIPL